MPVLEAMAHHCPVVCGQTSSIPEVAGDAALACDMASAETLSAALERIVFSESLRADLIARGIRRAMEFSWDRTASQTLRAYEQAMTRRNTA